MSQSDSTYSTKNEETTFRTVLVPFCEVHCLCVSHTRSIVQNFLSGKVYILASSVFLFAENGQEETKGN